VRQRQQQRKEMNMSEDVNETEALACLKDLSRDNRIVELLERRDYLAGAIRMATEEKRNLDAELVAKLDGHLEATAPGWRIKVTMVHIREHVRPAQEQRRIVAKRSPANESAAQAPRRRAVDEAGEEARRFVPRSQAPGRRRTS
jgi:hypothetical protein